MNKQTKYAISKNVIFEKENSKYLIYISSKEYFISLNILGSFIFDKIVKKYSKEKIAISILKEFSVSEKIANNDLDIFLKKLVDLKVILVV